MIKRIVMMEGGVETLSYFSHQMAQEFQKLGYAVFFYDLKQEESSAGKLRKFGYYAPSGVVDFSDLRAYIQKRGGIFQASADENTDCMICNDPTQAPDRIARAAELGVPVITEAEFLSIASTIPKRNYYSTT